MPFATVNVKALFFDRVAVISKLDPEVRKALAKFGAFVRQRAKTSIRNAPKKTAGRSSSPGSPPYNRTSMLKKFIFFSYDPERRSVVIGPTPAGANDGAPEALEHGGIAKIHTRGKVKTVYIRPRPFMAPAFDAELQKVGGNFMNIL